MRTYHSPKRNCGAEHTRQRIIAAAARQLRSGKGLAGLSLESVAAQAGVTRMTVYKQFGSRRGVLEAVFDHVARRGGLHRLSEVMAEGDPRAALQRTVAIFCDFWYFNRRTMTRILGAGATEPALGRAIQARNERRRTLITAILRRMAGVEGVPAETFNEVVDVLFVLTGPTVFAGLEARGRSVETVCRMVQELAMCTLDRLKR